MDVWAIFKQISFYVKTCFDYFLATIENNLAAFHSNIWSHWPPPKNVQITFVRNLTKVGKFSREE